MGMKVPVSTPLGIDADSLPGEPETGRHAGERLAHGGDTIRVPQDPADLRSVQGIAGQADDVPLRVTTTGQQKVLPSRVAASPSGNAKWASMTSKGKVRRSRRVNASSERK